MTPDEVSGFQKDPASVEAIARKIIHPTDTVAGPSTPIENTYSPQPGPSSPSSWNEKAYDWNLAALARSRP